MLGVLDVAKVHQPKHWLFLLTRKQEISFCNGAKTGWTGWKSDGQIEI